MSDSIEAGKAALARMQQATNEKAALIQQIYVNGGALDAQNLELAKQISAAGERFQAAFADFETELAKDD